MLVPLAISPSSTTLLAKQEDWSVINRWFANVISAAQTIHIETRDDYLDVASLGGER